MLVQDLEKCFPSSRAQIHECLMRNLCNLHSSCRGDLYKLYPPLTPQLCINVCVPICAAFDFLCPRHTFRAFCFNLACRNSNITSKGTSIVHTCFKYIYFDRFTLKGHVKILSRTTLPLVFYWDR